MFLRDNCVILPLSIFRPAGLWINEGIALKKRISFTVIYLCLLSLFTLGVCELLFVDKSERVSVSENRMLSAFPALSASSVADGGFMDGFESYLSDAFFFRDEAASFHDGVMSLAALPDDGPVTGVVEDERLWDESAEQAAAFEQLLEGEQAVEAQGSPAQSTEETPAPAAPRAEARDVSVWLERPDGAREVLFTYPADAMQSFAELLDRYRAKLPEDGHLYFFAPQVADIANNVIGKTKYTDWGTDLVEVLQPLVGEGVTVVDDMAILSPYLNNSKTALYPTQDYHWHAIAASLTADELMRLQGIAPADYDQYCYYLSYKHDNIAYSTDKLAQMRYGPETIEIMAAISPAESYFLNYITQRQRTTFTMSEGGYVGFLGGHKGPWRLIEGGFHTGRRALIVGDCFTIPLIPYLAPYYDQIISTDVRDNFYSVNLSGGNIGDYIAAYDVDDIYVVWSTNARFYSDNIQSRMSAYLDLHY